MLPQLSQLLYFTRRLQSSWILLDTEERWLVSGTTASSVGAEADSRGFSNVDRTL